VVVYPSLSIMDRSYGKHSELDHSIIDRSTSHLPDSKVLESAHLEVAT
jgi:hypothetical protein